MTMTATTRSTPRAAMLDRPVAMRIAAAEYQRFLELMRSLRPADWTKPTECPGWDVRTMCAHLLGMVEMAASIREQRRQVKLALRNGGVFIDALTALQVDERADMTPQQIVKRFAQRAAKAAAARRHTPGFIRRRRLPVAQLVDEHEESWTIGYLVDVILTRDPWMHRADIARATGAEHVVTADHDGVLVADVVAEWAARHGEPYALRLTGPAGGHWQHGVGTPEIELDAVEFCRIVSGRAPGSGLLATQVPF